jgi:hypothetical protein
MVSAPELRAVRISGFHFSLLGSMTRNMGLSSSVPVDRNPGTPCDLYIQYGEMDHGIS